MSVKILRLITVVATTTTIALFTSSCTKTPTSNFSFDGTSKRAPQTVTFTNTSANAKEFAWDFGDGGTSTEQNPSHQFKNGGTFTVSLTAKNGKKNNILSKQMIVLPTPTAFKCSSMTLNSGFADNGSDYYKFVINGYSYKAIHDFTQGMKYDLIGLTTNVSVPMIITPLTNSSSIAIKSLWNTLPNSASFTFKPSDYIKQNTDDAYPTTINLKDSNFDFDLIVEWY